MSTGPFRFFRGQRMRAACVPPVVCSLGCRSLRHPKAMTRADRFRIASPTAIGEQDGGLALAGRTDGSRFTHARC